MSEPDSFLDEVTEEMRRDQLLAFLRRNAVWIAAIVLIVVGGAGFFEWRKVTQRAEAEARGDALYAALTAATPEARLEALGALSVEGADSAAFIDMQRANQHIAAGTVEDGLSILQAIASNGAVSDALRNVARLKLAAAGAGTLAPEAREEVLLPMLTEGHAMRGAALEQRALIRLEAGDTEAALEDLAAIGEDARAPEGLRDRAEQMIAILAPADAAAADGAGASDG